MLNLCPHVLETGSDVLVWPTMSTVTAISSIKTKNLYIKTNREINERISKQIIPYQLLKEQVNEWMND